MALTLEGKFTQNPLLRWREHSLLLGVSGGADSVAMLALFHDFWKNAPERPARLAVAHANHQLRGEESDEDERFVRNLCEERSLPFFSERLEIERTSDGLEDDARNARYAFLERTALHFGARYIALAHNADDQAETILHRILRGSGLLGLCGIAPQRRLQSSVVIIRPLLKCSRVDILEYLQEKKIAFRTDSSNSDVRLTRNRLRCDLIPRLEQEYNPSLREALCRLGAQAAEAQKFIEAECNARLNLCAKLAQDENSIEAQLEWGKLEGDESDFLKIEMIRLLWKRLQFPEQSMGFREWNELLATLTTSRGVRIFPGNIRAEYCPSLGIGRLLQAR
ncbi:MAG: tRNA lysidine(34) synthetase TilS [Planctomycetia bacterium]|nr:tRNA lysidine(34) synthetase TilS [Planctomycetia bacterium]